MIVLDNVHKRYKSRRGKSPWVLEEISLTIPSNVNVGLIGANGAENLYPLAHHRRCVDHPTKGRVERHCRVSWPMGFAGGLHDYLTGRQNAKFVARVHGHENNIKDRIAYINDSAELGDAFDKPVQTYSTGMRSRLQFAMSLAFDFDVYISDEVTAAGDAAFRQKALNAFKQLADRAGSIMVSHGEGTGEQFCQAGIWLNEGRAHWFEHTDDALKAYKESNTK